MNKPQKNEILSEKEIIDKKYMKENFGDNSNIKAQIFKTLSEKSGLKIDYQEMKEAAAGTWIWNSKLTIKLANKENGFVKVVSNLNGKAVSKDKLDLTFYDSMPEKFYDEKEHIYVSMLAKDVALMDEFTNFTLTPKQVESLLLSCDIKPKPKEDRAEYVKTCKKFVTLYSTYQKYATMYFDQAQKMLMNKNKKEEEKSSMMH